ncbi:hypothetical protein Si034_00524 [Streptococcus infantarius subsp. infantarius]|nr:hypothetical protein [Streptococcus infantarius subsp. infantarius]MCO4637604.1 hypothetical protein [Streptococcus infantarius subsp. infantarius]
MPDYLKKLVKFSFLGKINIDIVPESFKKFPEKYKSYLKKITRRRFMCDCASLEKLTKMSEMLNSQAERLEDDLKALDS